MRHYPALFQPGRLGPRTARNRVWMTAHATEFTTDHTYSAAHAAYYGERAAKGVAVITMEATAVHPTSQPRTGVVLAYEPSVVESYRTVAAAVQPHGTLLFAQLWHRGRETDSVVSRLPVWAPSPVPCAVYREIPHEMTAAEIDELVEGYARSAALAVDGGLDGVEIHGLAHGYLLGQFLSPATNHRTDDYGGSLDNRFRLVRRIIERVRAAVPATMVVGIRINGDDGDVENGLRTADWAEIARRIAATAAVDYISVSQGTYLDRMLIYGASPTPVGHQITATSSIRSAVGELPVVVVGRITTPDMAEGVLLRGDADFVGMARQLIADAEWVRKAAEGRANDIRPCVGANHCIASIARAALSCIHNPAVGREALLAAAPATPSTPASTGSVAVVGAGPAGLRAALTAAELGWEVTVFERADTTGGQVRWLSAVEPYREWLGITDWLTDQLLKAGVTIRLGHAATVADLAGQFDAHIIATGSSPRRDGWTALRPARWAPGAPAVPGTDQWNVFTVQDVLGEQVNLPASVLVVDDLGDRRALAVAEHLAGGARRRTVEIATRLTHVGAGLTDSHDLPSVTGRLRRLGVRLSAGVELVEIKDDQVTLTDVHNGERQQREPVDAVVLVTGQRANDALLRELGAVERQVVGVGDCVAPRRVFDAIWEGELAARRLVGTSAASAS
ncbi:2,4-dienoyl-CoA reductase [Parafrankia irregularis]|uniref:2,4-dienoyl-CoA reductase n=1 Tax=Parafrankia irregularis TaxID=795642 RepID=A0A0S4QJA2_9ACTN|nr:MULTISPECIES: FAD-dependent oxidoreductase [Parafrankia]MBE3200724.1 FAD-dependent oxidoreductase [Parafrankia sp. CH37]CUU54892.1 2,4-dienoyl-CoA reductase [Parafrankia irregularis]